MNVLSENFAWIHLKYENSTICDKIHAYLVSDVHILSTFWNWNSILFECKMVFISNISRDAAIHQILYKVSLSQYKIK